MPAFISMIIFLLFFLSVYYFLFLCCCEVNLSFRSSLSTLLCHLIVWIYSQSTSLTILLSFSYFILISLIFIIVAHYFSVFIILISSPYLDNYFSVFRFNYSFLYFLFYIYLITLPYLSCLSLTSLYFHLILIHFIRTFFSNILLLLIFI